MLLPPGRFFQMCWYVQDIHAAMRTWHAVSRTGPFYYVEHPVIDDYTWRGVRGTLDMTGALAQAGPIQIELVQQHNDVGSAYRDQFGPGEEGFHHIAAMVDDYDAELAHYRAQGCEIAHSGVVGGKRFCYIDTRPKLGFMVEILEENPAMREMFAVISNAAIGWDGSDPFRPISITSPIA